MILERLTATYERAKCALRSHTQTKSNPGKKRLLSNRVVEAHEKLTEKSKGIILSSVFLNSVLVRCSAFAQVTAVVFVDRQRRLAADFLIESASIEHPAAGAAL